jgi:heme A synthase
MHRADAVIGGVIVLAAAYFVWSRVKVWKQYKLERTEAAIAAAKAD